MINIPEFIRKIATSNDKGSAKTIFDSNILGMSCARVCPVEVLCVGLILEIYHLFDMLIVVNLILILCLSPGGPWDGPPRQKITLITPVLIQW